MESSTHDHQVLAIVRNSRVLEYYDGWACGSDGKQSWVPAYPVRSSCYDFWFTGGKPPSLTVVE